VFKTARGKLAAWKIAVFVLTGIAFAVVLPVAVLCVLQLINLQNFHLAISILVGVKVLTTVIFLFVMSALVKFLSIKRAIRNLTRKVEIKYRDKIYNVRGFMDTGNNLTDPSSGEDVVIISFNLYIKMFPVVDGYYINFTTVGKAGKMYVFPATIDGKAVKLGVTRKRFDGYDVLLNNNIIQ
jgi:stage II sporulation protein GA (sporulation sigma-E factor processing peptidase)